MRKRVIYKKKPIFLKLALETPFYGVPRLTAELKRRGYRVNHKRVSRLVPQGSLHQSFNKSCPT